MRVLKIGFYSFMFDETVNIGSLINELSRCTTLEQSYCSPNYVYYKKEAESISIEEIDPSLVFDSKEEFEARKVLSKEE